jgi:hypothetical protein
LEEDVIENVTGVEPPGAVVQIFVDVAAMVYGTVLRSGLLPRLYSLKSYHRTPTVIRVSVTDAGAVDDAV